MYVSESGQRVFINITRGINDASRFASEARESHDRNLFGHRGATAMQEEIADGALDLASEAACDAWDAFMAGDDEGYADALAELSCGVEEARSACQISRRVSRGPSTYAEYLHTVTVEEGQT